MVSETKNIFYEKSTRCSLHHLLFGEILDNFTMNPKKILTIEKHTLYRGGGNIAECFLPKNFGHIGKFGYIGPEILPPLYRDLPLFWKENIDRRQIGRIFRSGAQRVHACIAAFIRPGLFSMLPLEAYCSINYRSITGAMV